jgi:threonine 3-dehydrogenase
MSGSAAALRNMLANMCHGGKIAMLAFPNNTQIDWNLVVFHSLTIQGIYGRNVRDLVQDDGDAAERARHFPMITHPFLRIREAFEVMRSGQSGR